MDDSRGARRARQTAERAASGSAARRASSRADPRRSAGICAHVRGRFPWGAAVRRRGAEHVRGSRPPVAPDCARRRVARQGGAPAHAARGRRGAVCRRAGRAAGRATARAALIRLGAHPETRAHVWRRICADASSSDACPALLPRVLARSASAPALAPLGIRPRQGRAALESSGCHGRAAPESSGCIPRPRPA